MVDDAVTDEPLDFATRYDFLKSLMARYDSYCNLAAVKARAATGNAIFWPPAKEPVAELHTSRSARRLRRARSRCSRALDASMSRRGAGHRFMAFAQRRDRPPPLARLQRSVALYSADDYAGQVGIATRRAVIDDLARLHT